MKKILLYGATSVGFGLTSFTAATAVGDPQSFLAVCLAVVSLVSVLGAAVSVCVFLMEVEERL